MNDWRIKETFPENWRDNNNIPIKGVPEYVSPETDVDADFILWRNSCNNMEIMNILWKNDRDGVYVDPFTILGIEYANDMKQWEGQLIELKSPEAAQQSKKCNNFADEMMECGHTEFSNRNFEEALNYYNRALCFAEPGTFYEGLAYGNRGLCFFQMDMCQKALVDFEFASRKKCPEPYMNDIQNLRIECQKVEKNKGKTKNIPKMKLPIDKKFPCMVNALEIKGNKDFGRCVVAKKDIEVGQTVFVAEAFASAVIADKQAPCNTCHKTLMNFIPCGNCSDVMFCDEDCANWNTLHKIECGTCYHQIDDISVKFTIQTIMTAIETFPNIDALIQMVESVVTDEGCDRIPKSSNDAISKYAIFLKLTPVFLDQHLFHAYKVFTSILHMPKIKYMFDTEPKQRFLMHLILHHTNVQPKNGFLDVPQFSDQFIIKYIFDVLSFINHSCAPNLDFRMFGKTGCCLTVRPIKKGDQVFINYLGYDVHKPSEQRREILKKIWGFDCQCDKCVDGSDCVNNDAMKTDPSLKYVIRNYEESQHWDTVSNTKRLTLKKQCIKFLKKYGHLPWTTELDYISHCFTSL